MARSVNSRTTGTVIQDEFLKVVHSRPTYYAITATQPVHGASGTTHPPTETTAAGPFENWPTGLGFEYFYGFLAGEASQYEPHLVRNTTVVLPPKTPAEGYHISEDLADDAINWLQTHKALSPDKPFYMYWASGALHGPHHVNKEWADKYKGKFDEGWDAYRERAFKNAKAKGWIPENAQLTPRHPRMAAWDSIPEHQKTLSVAFDGSAGRLCRTHGSSGWPHCL